MPAPAYSYFREVPTIQEERDAYLSWGETIQSGAPLSETWATAGTLPSQPDIHGSVEADDIWLHLHQWRRTRRAFYRRMLDQWVDFYLNRFRSTQGASWLGDRNSFGYDHVFVAGLVDYYEMTGVQAALNEAIAIVEEIHDDPDLNGAGIPSPTASMASDAGRKRARHLLAAAHVSRYAPGNTKVVNLRNGLMTAWAQTPDWHTVPGNGGMYFGQSFTNNSNIRGSGAWQAGDRATSVFHIGWIAEALWRALKVHPGHADAATLRQRILDIAAWSKAYVLHPTYQVASDIMGHIATTLSGNQITASTLWYKEAESTPETWNPLSTASICNVLVMRYKMTGDVSYLNHAKTVWLRHNGGIYNQHPIDNRNPLIHHYADTRADTSTGRQFMDYNRGELCYTYMLFQRGGSPALEDPLS